MVARSQQDWKRLPTEAREQLLALLESRSALGTFERLSAVELAQRTGLDPDPWQRDLLNSTERQVILLCSRQSGKSTLTALLGLHQALYTPGSLVLILAPSQRQSMETYRKVRDAYSQLPGAPEPTQESSLKLELENRSRIQVLPGKEGNVRGFSGVSLLIVDEAARVEDGLYMALRPMLAVSGGRIVLLSTPFGSRGFFHKEWAEGDGWRRFKVTASECPRISPEWLEKERARIGSWWFSQEYECTFNDNVDQVFSTRDIDGAISTEVKPLWT
jgi:Terminase large subunit, T4likevirus-type, N-terminal